MEFFELEVYNSLKEEMNAKDGMKKESDKKEAEEKEKKSTKQFFDEVVKATGLPAKTVRRILLWLQAALYKSDGSNTAFVEKYSVKYELPSYKGLVEFLKDVKALYRSDREISAFEDLNELWKSQIGVLGA